MKRGFGSLIVYNCCCFSGHCHVGTKSNLRSNRLFFCSLTSFFSMLVTCLSSVTQLSITYSYILWNQLCGLGLVQPIWDARGLAWTLELKDRLSDWEVQEVCFTQSFMLNLVLTIIQTIWFFEVRDLNDMSLKCPSCVLQIVCNSLQHSAFVFSMPGLWLARSRLESAFCQSLTNDFCKYCWFEKLASLHTLWVTGHSPKLFSQCFSLMFDVFQPSHARAGLNLSDWTDST